MQSTNNRSQFQGLRQQLFLKIKLNIYLRLKREFTS